MKDMKKNFTELSSMVIGCAIEVHKTLGIIGINIPAMPGT